MDVLTHTQATHVHTHTYIFTLYMSGSKAHPETTGFWPLLITVCYGMLASLGSTVHRWRGPDHPLAEIAARGAFITLHGTPTV